MGDHWESRMHPEQTYLTSGWHIGMSIICKNGDPGELFAVFNDEGVVESPNANYQLKLGEGPASVDNEWAGFTLLHYVVERYYQDRIGKAGAQAYIEKLLEAGCRADAYDISKKTAQDHDRSGVFPMLHPNVEYDDVGCEAGGCLACVGPSDYGDDDGLKPDDKWVAGEQEYKVHAQKQYARTGQYS